MTIAYWEDWYINTYLHAYIYTYIYEISSREEISRIKYLNCSLHNFVKIYNRGKSDPVDNYNAITSLGHIW